MFSRTVRSNCFPKCETWSTRHLPRRRCALLAEQKLLRRNARADQGRSEEEVSVPRVGNYDKVPQNVNQNSCDYLGHLPRSGWLVFPSVGYARATSHGETQDAKKRLLNTEAHFASRPLSPVRVRHAPSRSPEVCPSRSGTLSNSQERRSLGETVPGYFLRWSYLKVWHAPRNLAIEGSP